MQKRTKWITQESSPRPERGHKTTGTPKLMSPANKRTPTGQTFGPWSDWNGLRASWPCRRRSDAESSYSREQGGSFDEAGGFLVDVGEGDENGVMSQFRSTDQSARVRRKRCVWMGKGTGTVSGARR